uniref:Uncharacterized protein n=1 Tax=Arundo donax TaxID=35708 RepID=A0A0A8Z6U1_ARUDO
MLFLYECLDLITYPISDFLKTELYCYQNIIILQKILI